MKAIETFTLLHLFKLSLLKKYLYALNILTIVCGCNLPTSNKETANDSIKYIAPALAPVNKEELRLYKELLSSYFDSMLISKSFNGGILVAKDGNIIYESYIGNIHLGKNEPITDSTSFQLASTSKPFTAVAILRLVQENKLSLNDSLNKFFPALSYKGITVKMLLNHHSGLPNYIYFFPVSNWDQHQYVTNNDVLNFLDTTKLPPVFSPGTRFNYCNTNFVLLALIIEKITGKTYPDYMKMKFFKPLQMDHTFVFTTGDSARATPSYNYNSTFWQNDFLEMTYGDKNIYSTPRDLLKWDQALYTDQILNKELKDAAFSPSIINPKDSLPAFHNYGLGFHLTITTTGKKVIFHFGRWHGFNAAFARLTDEKVTIIILGNKFTRRIYDAAYTAYNLFGNYFPKPETEEEYPGTPAEFKKVSSKNLKTIKSYSKSGK